MMFDDVYIELIEDYPCNSKAELLKREGEIIRQTPNCVNRCVAGRTKKEWDSDNREHVQEYSKSYEAIRRENPERKEYMRKWRENNKTPLRSTMYRISK
jgi:hypothetical protein